MFDVHFFRPPTVPRCTNSSFQPASITFRFTDAGEPGTADEMEFTISGPGGATVSGVLMKGNHQAEQN